MDYTAFHNVLELNIKCIYELESIALVATKIPTSNKALWGQALDDYYAFVENVLSLLDYYDFVPVRSRGPGPDLSYYYYLAHQTQLSSGDVPIYIKLRIATHTPKHKSAEHMAKIIKETRKTLDEIKLPDSKKKQRYRMKYITANSAIYNTYEEVLSETENQIRGWFSDLGIPLTGYDYIGSWE